MVLAKKRKEKKMTLNIQSTVRLPYGNSLCYLFRDLCRCHVSACKPHACWKETRSIDTQKNKAPPFGSFSLVYHFVSIGSGSICFLFSLCLKTTCLFWKIRAYFEHGFDVMCSVLGVIKCWRGLHLTRLIQGLNESKNSQERNEGYRGWGE